MRRQIKNRSLGILTAIFLIACTGHPHSAQDKESIQPEVATNIIDKDVVYAKSEMVVSAHRLATQSGMKILDQGGNALDAAVAVQMALGVVEPQSSGLGGGGFLLYYNKSKNKIYAYDGRESAPEKIKPDVFLDEKGQPKEFYSALVGGQSVGVPGVLKMLAQAHREQGHTEWKKLFEPAISLAQGGFKISPRLHQAIQDTPNLNTFASTRSYFFESDGKTPKVTGTVLKNPELAQTLQLIADQGVTPFYEGEIARDMVKTVQGASRNPGFLELSDLSGYEVKVHEPICYKYHRFDVCGFPPPTSGGVTTLQILGLLENYDLSKLKYDSVDFLQLFTQASKLAYADRDLYLADPDFVAQPTDKLLDESYLKERAELISMEKDTGVAKAGEILAKAAKFAPAPAVEFPCTSHFSIVDKDGNVATFTTSVENAFGSTLMVRGFILNNTMTDFSFVSQVNGVPVANRIEPHKRPRSSMAPVIVFDDEGEFYLTIGSPGGPRIIDYVAKVLVGVLDFHLDIQDAIELPNVANRNGPTDVEKGTKLEDLVDDLQAKGHTVNVIDLNSGLHGIQKTGRGYAGGADSRREGVVLGE